MLGLLGRNLTRCLPSCNALPAAALQNEARCISRHISICQPLKNEQKRRLKAEQKLKDKAEKEANKKQEMKEVTESQEKSNEISEENITPNDYFKFRGAAIQKLKTTDEHPYPHKYHVSISLQEFIEKFKY